jgi:UDP-2,3-diacylglucosamine hydrolase
MAIAFISDLHLDENQPVIADIFLRFLEQQAPQLNALYILGDFFESWIGDDNLTVFNEKIISALRKTTQRGLPVFFMHGNRDFLIGKNFLRVTGCQLLPEEYVLNIYGTPTLLMHGDTLCTEDKAYLKFRKKARCWLVQKLFLCKSLEKRSAIANQYRRVSKEYTSTAPDHITDVTQTEVERKMRKHKVKHLLHGHTHRQAIHDLKLDDQAASRIVLGAWHEHGNALIFESSSEKKFIVID